MFGRFSTTPYALFLPLIPIMLITAVSWLHPTPQYQRPDQIPYWAFFFGLPHILSSFQTMCDKEYLLAYKKQTLIILCLFVFPFLVFNSVVPSQIIYGTLFALTIHHIVAQQYGICLSVAQLRPSIISEIFKWCTIILGVLLFFRANFFGNHAFSLTLISLTDFISAPFLVIIAALSCLLIWRARQNLMGATMMAFNAALLTGALLLVLNNHQLIGFMIFRIFHDTTGFIVYINHDINRNSPVRKNLLYRLFPLFPVWALNITLAFTFAAALSYLASYSGFIAWLLVGIAIAHYYIESVIWRGNTPHRQHVNLSFV